MLLAERRSVRAERFLSKLIEDGYGEQVWLAVSKALENNGVFRLEWALNRIGFADVVSTQAMLDWAGDDEKRGRTLARLAGVHAPELGPLPRGLLKKFGSHGAVANDLRARALSTPPVVSSFVSFFLAQREHALRWKQDDEAGVAAWAENLVVDLDRSIEREKLREDAGSQYA